MPGKNVFISHFSRLVSLFTIWLAVLRALPQPIRSDFFFIRPRICIVASVASSFCCCCCCHLRIQTVSDFLLSGMFHVPSFTFGREYSTVAISLQFKPPFGHIAIKCHCFFSFKRVVRYGMLAIFFDLARKIR